LLSVIFLAAVLCSCSARKAEQNADIDAIIEDDYTVPDTAKPATDQVPTETAASDPESLPPQDVSPEPVSQPEALPPVATNGDLTDYSIRRGDTLMKIAFETYGDLHQWK